LTDFWLSRRSWSGGNSPFLDPVHGCPRLFKNLGLMTYLMPAVTWARWPMWFMTRGTFCCNSSWPCGCRLRIRDNPVPGRSAAECLDYPATELPGLIGIPEILLRSRQAHERGLFQLCGIHVSRPRIDAFGVFLMSGVIAVAALTFLDLVLINAVVIPLEERELLGRFGDTYKKYKEKVSGFSPGCAR